MCSIHDRGATDTGPVDAETLARAVDRLLPTDCGLLLGGVLLDVSTPGGVKRVGALLQRRPGGPMRCPRSWWRSRWPSHTSECPSSWLIRCTVQPAAVRACAYTPSVLCQPIRSKACRSTKSVGPQPNSRRLHQRRDTDGMQPRFGLQCH